MFGLLKRLISVALLGLVAAGGLAWWWLDQPLPLGADAPLLVEVPPGSSARGVAQRLSRAGVQVPPLALEVWFRASGQAQDIKAGVYEVPAGFTPKDLLRRLVSGDQALFSVSIIEGWTYRQVLDLLRRHPDLTPDLQGLNDAQVMSLIGKPGVHPEGRFFPDTYRVARKSPASSVLRQAAAAMDAQLAQAWAQRAPDSPLRTPEQALILASIVEKETGLASDRPEIAGVFSNRLRIGMRLQTDPTIIYGLGERFDGNLRRVHLETDGPYNTYTRAGLPPTPIALPGQASLLAAVQPKATSALYFVARGDGSSQFSATLDEHNAAVRRYILNR